MCDFAAELERHELYQHEAETFDQTCGTAAKNPPCRHMHSVARLLTAASEPGRDNLNTVTLSGHTDHGLRTGCASHDPIQLLTCIRPRPGPERPLPRICRPVMPRTVTHCGTSVRRLNLQQRAAARRRRRSRPRGQSPRRDSDGKNQHVQLEYRRSATQFGFMAARRTDL